MRERAVVPDVEPATYYGRPVLKAPVWEWPVPAYFFVGGLAGASSLLAAGARLGGWSRLARHARWTALYAISAGAALLVKDLGRPLRFYNMLRVAKPTSPMSMGTWLLCFYAPAAAVAAAGDLVGLPPPLSGLATWLAASAGPAVTTYTAVILSDTAVPVWHEARSELPFVFAGSSAAAAGGVAMLTTAPTQAAPARALALMGAAMEVGVSHLSRRRPGEIGAVYDQGRAGALERLSTALTCGGAVVSGVWGRRRLPAAFGGAMLVGGSLVKRFAVVEAGRQSADDPRHTVGPQRRRLDR